MMSPLRNFDVRLGTGGLQPYVSILTRGKTAGGLRRGPDAPARESRLAIQTVERFARMQGSGELPFFSGETEPGGAGLGLQNGAELSGRMASHSIYPGPRRASGEDRSRHGMSPSLHRRYTYVV